MNHDKVHSSNASAYWDYDKAVSYIYDIPRFTKKGGIEQTKKLMALIGNPQDHMKYIHVAGTNGKGSVSILMANALQACGFRTGLFTSPHLIRINERMRIDGVMITDQSFMDLFVHIKYIVDRYVADGGVHPTFFEWMYMMAMYWFRENQIEYAVVETGLGGRLDATNVVFAPELTVITSIGLDHEQYLGHDLASIAKEKAGIIKKHVPLVYDCSEKEASQAITDIFLQVNPDGTECCPVSVDDAAHILYKKDGIDYDTEIDGEVLNIHLLMTGTYQVDNSLLVLQGLSVLGRKHQYFGYDKHDFYQMIANAMNHTLWAGRMEKVSDRFYIDGAHNDAGILALTKTLAVHFSDEDIYLLFAVAEDKDYTKMIRTLCSLRNIKGVMVTAIDSIRRSDTKEVADLFIKFGHAPVRQTYNIKEALHAAMEWAGDHVLCCCGSLYLAGSVKEILA